MSVLSAIMESAPVYRIWQAPYARQKLAPVRRHNDLRRALRVLDVGCGPGTNTPAFTHARYVGVDCNHNYLRYARARYGKNFAVVDARRPFARSAARFDFILLNSFLHHFCLEDTRGILSRLKTLLTDDGSVHILDLVMPERHGVAHALARLDRGEFARTVDEWRRIFCEAFEPVLFEPYVITTLGIPLWHMVYFKGGRRA